MTRKHFQALASELLLSKPPRLTKTSAVTVSEAYRQWEKDVTFIADACSRANSAFNRAKFYLACGIVCPQD